MIRNKRYRAVFVMIVMLLLAALPVTSAFADSSGPNNAGAGASVSAGTGTIAWSNPGNITTVGSPYASVTLGGGNNSQYLQGTQYGFAIPTGATIDGITVVINRFASQTNSISDNSVRLLKAGTLAGSDKASASNWPSSLATATYGGATDLWGTTWTPADINATNFGVSLSVANNVSGNRTATVDYMQITVNYRVNTTTSVNCGSGTPVVTYGSSITCQATVTRGGGSQTPTGNVTWGTSGTGSFGTSTCTGASGTLTCNVSYTPGSVGSGSHTITATYAGDTNFNGSNGNQAVTVNQANQTIAVTTPAPASAVFGASFTVSATASSGLPVAFSASGACTNVDATFTMTSGTGTCTVLYDQAGDTNYSAATQVTETVTAQLAAQTIAVTTPAPASAMLGASFTVSATASSGLPVSFSALGVCTNVGATFTMTSRTGTCTVQYDQAGNTNYNAAPQVTESVTAVNNAPVAVNDSHTAVGDTVLTIAAPGVLGNDTDVDGDTLTAMLDTDPSHGTLTLHPDGSFVYTPTLLYIGPDSFTYHANDGLLNSNVATVTLTVAAVNHAPVAVDDSYTTAEDTVLTVAATGVLTNDTDVDGDTLNAVLDAGPTHGTLALHPNGSLVYTPTLDYNGQDSFTYHATDGSLASNVATVTLTVTAVNDAPVANAGPDQQVKPNSLVTLDGRASTDPDGNLPLLFGWTQTGGTAVSFSRTLSVTTFTAPATPQVLTFTLTVTDTLSLASTPDTVVLTVRGYNIYLPIIMRN